MWEFPGGSVVKTQHFHCWGPGSILQFSSVQSLSCTWLFATPWTAAHQASLSITNSQSFLNSCQVSWWCYPTISFSVVPFSSCLQSFPGSGSFPTNQCFSSGCQSIGASVSTSVLLMNIQDWFPLGLTGWISLQSKGLSRVFFNATVKIISSSAPSFLYRPALTSTHD